MSEPGRQFRRADRAHTSDDPAALPSIPPGRTTQVGTSPASTEGLCLQQLRIAVGAVTQIKTTWIPSLEQAQREHRAASGTAVVDARSALRRAEAAIAQATALRVATRSAEIDTLWDTATGPDSVAARARLDALLEVQDELANASPLTAFGAPMMAAPADAQPALATPQPAPVAAPVTPAHHAPASAVLPTAVYAPTWDTIAKAAAGDKTARDALDVDWIDSLHAVIASSIDGAFARAVKTQALNKEIAANKQVQDIDSRYKAEDAKVISDETAARKAAKQDHRAATIKKDPAVVAKLRENDDEHAAERDKAVAAIRAAFEARKHKVEHERSVATAPADGVTNEQGRLLARANFMSWGSKVLGSIAALKAHYKGMENVPAVANSGGTLFLAKSAASRLVAAQNDFQNQYPGNTFFKTTVGFGLRGVHHESHKASYLGHALGYSIDFQAVANPSFLNKENDISGSVTMMMVKKFAGQTVGGKHVDGVGYMKMDGGKKYDQIQAMGEKTAKGDALSAQDDALLKAAGAAYDVMTATSDRFRASQAANMAELTRAKQAWIDLNGRLAQQLAAANKKLAAAEKAAAKPGAEAAAAQAVTLATKERDELQAKLDAAPGVVNAAIDKAFGPWVQQLEAEIAEISQPVAAADKELIKNAELIESTLKTVRAASKREQLAKVLANKTTAPLFAVDELTKIADHDALKAKMVERLVYLRGKTAAWNAGELNARKLLVKKLSTAKGVFGKVEHKRDWQTKPEVNAVPVMQLLELGFARHDELADPNKDPKRLKDPKQVFNREFIQTMMKFGFAPLTMYEAFVDTMHFDFLEGFTETTAGDFDANDHFAPGATK